MIIHLGLCFFGRSACNAASVNNFLCCTSTKDSLQKINCVLSYSSVNKVECF